MGPGFTDLEEFLAEEFGDIRGHEGRWSDLHSYLYLDENGHFAGTETPEERKVRAYWEKQKKAKERVPQPPKAKKKRGPNQNKNEYNRLTMRAKRQNKAYREHEKAQQKEYREKTPGMRQRNAEYSRAYRARKKAEKLMRSSAGR